MTAQWQRSTITTPLEARLQDSQRYAEIDARVGDHVLGAWQTERTGRRDHLLTSASCSRCSGTAYVSVEAGVGDATYGPVILGRCPAMPGNRCEEASSINDADGAHLSTTSVCKWPYLTVWQRNEPSRPGTIKLCLRHSRAYRLIASGENPNGWHQILGPTDYGDDPRQWIVDAERAAVPS